MRSAHKVLTVVLLSVISVLSVGALAAPTIYYAVDQAVIHQLLGEMGLEYELFLDNSDDPTWTFTHMGILITVISYDQVASGSYASLLFYTGWATDDDILLSRINDWNSGSRFGRAYVDDSGDPVIELDLLIAGGVTADTIREYITVFAEAASSLGVALHL
jgi:hypothetical protein